MPSLVRSVVDVKSERSITPPYLPMSASIDADDMRGNLTLPPSLVESVSAYENGGPAVCAVPAYVWELPARCLSGGGGLFSGQWSAVANLIALEFR